MSEGTKEATGLLGLWVVFPDPGDGEYSQTGQVTLSIGDHHLVKIHPPKNGVPPFSKLMSSEALAADNIYIFDTREELEAFMAFNPDDDKPRVVSMRRPT
jgi:hypothetical protein